MSHDTIERHEVSPDEPPLHVDKWERNWIGFSIALLVVFMAAVSIAGFTAGFQLPGAESEVDPRVVADEPPWSEPGLREIGEGQYEAYVLAQTWSFAPRELVVPVGAEVDIYVTSPDLQHGFKITDTNVNMQIVPGQVSKLTYTFDEVGEFPYICTEYCGQGHAAMFGTVRVLAEADFEAQADGTETPADTTEATEADG